MKKRNRILAVLITILAVSLVFVISAPTAKALPGGDILCFRKCATSYSSCVSGCTFPECYWRCYDRYMFCMDGCDGAHRPGIYFC